MSKICHQHCPGGPPVLPAAIVAVAFTVAAVSAAAYAASVLVALLAAAAMTSLAGLAWFTVLMRRSPVMWRPGSVHRATDRTAPRALPAPRRAITARQVIRGTVLLSDLPVRKLPRGGENLTPESDASQRVPHAR